MRLSDLLGSRVFDENGEEIGRVHEVRAVQDGPLQDAFGAALRIEALIVGRGSMGTRLGLDRPDARSPALVRIIFEGVRGKRRFVPWDNIVAIQQHRIDVSGTADDFEAPPELLSEHVDADSPA
jgi:PRC-barrel domain